MAGWGLVSPVVPASLHTNRHVVSSCMKRHFTSSLFFACSLCECVQGIADSFTWHFLVCCDVELCHFAPPKFDYLFAVIQAPP